MDRNTLTAGAGHFGRVEYAREELRAEMSAMMTGERVGVGHDGSRGAAYVEGWIKALDTDPKEMYKAAADAQNISDYLMRPIKEREQTTEKEHAQLAEKDSAARSPQISHAPTPQPQAPQPERESGISREAVAMFDRTEVLWREEPTPEPAHTPARDDAPTDDQARPDRSR